MTYKRVSVDTSKAVFTVHAIDEADRPVQRQDYTRARFTAWIASLAPTEFALEACGSAHHWGRVLAAQGHRVRLIPPQYVKPFVKRGKNDRIDAAAISEAAGRPGMSTVAVKSAQRQAEAMVLRTRERLVAQRTQLANAIRGHAAEFGVIAARGIGRLDELLAHARTNAGVPALAVRELDRLKRAADALDKEITALDAELEAAAKTDPQARRLMAVPGIGAITAMTITARVDAAQFETGRHLAAWLGLVPRENSSGGKQRLGRISKAGDERIRQVLVLGATAVIRHAKPGSRTASPWLLALLARKPRKLAAVALANKMARIVWAMMTRGTAYRPSMATT